MWLKEEGNMSCSTLYLLDKDMKIQETEDFDNAWLMSPNIWEILHTKYIGNSYNMFLVTEESEQDLQSKMSKRNNLEDMFLYLMTHQHLISLRYKDKVIELLNEFLISTPINYYSLHDRLQEVIDKLEDTNASYFIWKNTSIDDAVENRFDDTGSLDKDKFKGEPLICELKTDNTIKWLKWE